MARGTIGRNTASGRALLEIIESVERIREDRKRLAEDESAKFAAAKAAGYDPKIIRAVLKRRAAKPVDLEEAEAQMDMYLHAIGMQTETPLFRAVGLMNIDLAARDEVISAFKLLVPQSGEIIIKIGSQPVRLWRDETGEARADDFDEAPATRPKRDPGASSRPPQDVPDVDETGARDLGGQAYRDNRPITANPFPWDDRRRAAFDQGWRVASGTDGMGPEEEED